MNDRESRRELESVNKGCDRRKVFEKENSFHTPAGKETPKLRALLLHSVREGFQAEKTIG